MSDQQKNLVLARLVLVFHIVFILHYIVGTLIAWKFRWYAWVQLANLVGTVIVHLKWHGCPFTALEKKYLHAAGKVPYSGTLYQHYFFKKFFGITVSKSFVSWFLSITKLVPALLGALLLLA
jgi:hypothetical protein